MIYFADVDVKIPQEINKSIKTSFDFKLKQTILTSL